MGLFSFSKYMLVVENDNSQTIVKKEKKKRKEIELNFFSSNCEGENILIQKEKKRKKIKSMLFPSPVFSWKLAHRLHTEHTREW